MRTTLLFVTALCHEETFFLIPLSAKRCPTVNVLEAIQRERKRFCEDVDASTRYAVNRYVLMHLRRKSGTKSKSKLLQLATYLST